MWPINNNKRPLFFEFAGWLSVSLLLGFLAAFFIQSRITRAPIEVYLEQVAGDLSRETAKVLAKEVWNLDERGIREYFCDNIWRHLGVNSVRVLTEFDDEIFVKAWTDESDHVFHRAPVLYKGKVAGYVEIRVSKNRLFVLQNALERLGVLFATIALVVVLIVCMILVRLIIIRPLRKTLSGLRRIAGGEYGLRLPPGRSAELDRINQEINSMSGEILNHKDRLESEIAVRRRAEQDLSALNEELDQRVKDRTRQLEESEQRFRTLFEEAGDAIVLVDVGPYTVFDSNKAASEWLGYPRGELLRLEIFELYRADDLLVIREWIKKALWGETVSAADVVMKRKDGDLVYADISVFMVRIKGKPYLAGFFRDVTARKNEERNRLEHQKQLRRMAGLLASAKDAEQRRIAEGLHDDVAQLIAASRMKLQLIARCDDPDQVRRILDETDELIAQAHERLRSLSFELASSTLFRLGLKAALEELCEGMSQRYAAHFSLECERDFGVLPEETATILFKSARELLFNVVKHSGTDTARILLSSENRGIKLIVEDRGKGFKELPGVTHRGNGSGLGLFGIRERLEDIGGTIRIESEPGQYTRIILWLPFLEEVRT